MIIGKQIDSSPVLYHHESLVDGIVGDVVAAKSSECGGYSKGATVEQASVMVQRLQSAPQIHHIAIHLYAQRVEVDAVRVPIQPKESLYQC